MDLYLYKTVVDYYFYCFKVAKAFFFSLLLLCSHGNNFNPNRSVIAVCFEWVTSSWSPFNCCLLVKISTISFCHMDEISETTESEQKAVSSLCESSSTFCLLWFSHFTELWRVCFLHIFFSSTEALTVMAHTHTVIHTHKHIHINI